MAKVSSPKDFPEPPFGIVALWGARKVGKTIAAINSPWQPVHVIDVEFSSKDYEDNREMVKELGLITEPWTRESCLVYSDFLIESGRIIKGSDFYGTIVLDTVGQITEWIKTAEFSKNLKKSEKMSQVVWGEVRDRLRGLLLKLQLKTKLIILTAHEREYPPNNFSPRANPAILELASLSFRLTRAPNQKIPDGIVDIARIPVFPPKIPTFTIEKLLDYYKAPTNWDDLKEEEKIDDVVTTPIPPEPD
jgi:hypothetical protein